MGTIQVTGLGKAYRQYASRWGRLAEWLLPSSRPRHQKKWILHDISFAVAPGEAVGIVGVNGAGKSTLLKLITGTTQPSCGTVAIQGRVAALLELGMGFHPDFTGRQNAYMAGQLIGLSADDITRLMPEIEAFAEIGDYLDMPVRVYSSGMSMRLAFSIATCQRPDILIVDEALSVGDAYFQHKSFNRIREFGKQGTTLLIVSHDKAAIQSICNRAILLEHGRVAMEGEPEAVMDYYNALIAENGNRTVQQATLADGRTQTQSGSGEASITAIGLYNAEGEPVEVVKCGEEVALRVTARVNAPLDSLVLGYAIKDRLGQAAFGTNTYHLGAEQTQLQPGEQIHYTLRFPANLGAGSYSVAVALHASDTHVAGNYEWRDRALIFNMINTSQPEFVGTAWLPSAVEFSRE
ncbi:sugar ABC transporter ATP-binding protein [Aquaspirillum sp. LM1]|uniref:ABC transporter ATP-binding protein n=1 Tax=Aquaspirillum sp. LM1 TaxID=1938604 RepID=UPI000983CD85|nr:ABC transporter ATP-binding protein [Aquaspirillum sp. LM1]AQR66356.1 sugar ABC transporter ATP-binding protein [Aquaspirillum sp. LM1]